MREYENPVRPAFVAAFSEGGPVSPEKAAFLPGDTPSPASRVTAPLGSPPRDGAIRKRDATLQTAETRTSLTLRFRHGSGERPHLLRHFAFSSARKVQARGDRVHDTQRALHSSRC